MQLVALFSFAATIPELQWHCKNVITKLTKLYVLFVKWHKWYMEDLQRPLDDKLQRWKMKSRTHCDITAHVCFNICGLVCKMTRRTKCWTVYYPFCHYLTTVWWKHVLCIFSEITLWTFEHQFWTSHVWLWVFCRVDMPACSPWIALFQSSVEDWEKVFLMCVLSCLSYHKCV